MRQPDDGAGRREMARRVRAILAGSLGNLVEWYDFYVYAAFALYFAPAFFPAKSEILQQLNAAVLFALGFLARPIGAYLFGVLADRRGRRAALTISVLLMCAGSLAIALMPTYATIGAAAPIALGVVRILQGLSLGGEYGTSATYLSEVADEQHRGFYSSFQYVTLIGGQLCALTVLMILQELVLTPVELRAWGWRIAFAIGGLLGFFTAVMRRNMHETDAFLAERRGPRPSALRELLRHPREVLLVVGMTMGGTAAFYTYTTYMQKFLKLSVKLSDRQTTLVTAGSLLLALVLQPLYGALSDRVGRKPLLVGFGLCGTLLTIPILTALQRATSPLGAFALIGAAWLIVSGYTSINAVVKAELFPASIRATGVGLPYAVTVSVFGGTAESIALAFKAHHHETYFYAYLTGCIAISFLVYVFMRDTKRRSTLSV